MVSNAASAMISLLIIALFIIISVASVVPAMRRYFAAGFASLLLPFFLCLLGRNRIIPSAGWQKEKRGREKDCKNTFHSEASSW